MMNTETVVVMPVREGSSRIQEKNFLPFAGYPTLVHQKIAHLQAAACFDHIYISSDSARARDIAEACGIEYLPRDPHMCTSTPRWDEVVSHVMDTVPGDPHVAWAMVTSPLFTRYAAAVECYHAHQDTHDSLMGVKPIREYLVDDTGRPLFYSFGAWHPYSNELKPMYAINDVVFIARKSDQLQWRYWIGRKPYLFECKASESIDVNFPEDLHMARLAWEAQQAEVSAS
jgi:CMP-N-acetylneuraminic acid synthetase